jgi:plastocyanin
LASIASLMRRGARFLVGNPTPRILIERKNGTLVFTPNPLQIPLNERVFWVNDDTDTHQINLTGEELKRGSSSSDVIITGDRNYFCMLHPTETGAIKITGTV